MKKSKIIVPALGILLLSTAASISGTVAWFTANRTFNFTAGEFAVVNTKNNLKATLTAGAGTSIAGDEVQVIDGYKLTDASLDHTVAAANVVVPDDEGKVVEKSVSALQAKGTLESTTALIRDDANHIYSAFTWDVTFSLNISTSETKRMGLFLDLSDANTYVHEAVYFKAGDTIAASTYYSSADLTGDALAAGTADASTVAGNPYYKAAPDDTGKALRIAMIPTAVSDNCYGVAKVWAENQVKAKCLFTDGLADDAALVGTAYGTATISKTGAAGIATDTVGTDMVLMCNGDNTAVPADNTIASSAAKEGKSNYIGYFAPTAGETLSMTFRFVAWYEGTDENITNDADTIYETCVVGMQFGTSRFTDPA